MKKIILFCLMVICSSVALSQLVFDELTSDELFFIARDKAFNGQRDSARILLKMALQKSPAYDDIRVFLARTYAWDGMRNEARNEISSVLSRNSSNKEALSVAIDIELWDDKPTAALELSIGALRHFPNDEEFLLKKAKSLKDLGRDDEALITLSILEEINPSNPDVQKMRETIKSTMIMQGASVNETYDYYSNTYDAAHLVYLQYNRSTFLGSFIGRMNYGRRFQKDGLQFELDAYPRIVSGVYGYLNYGYSGASIFPKQRLGAEAFFKLPSSFEASIGMRYLFFGGTSDVTMYTGTVGYYYKDYWFSLRPFITPSNVSFSRSLSFTARYYYMGIAEEYISAKIGAGFSPDERNYDPANKNVYYLKAQTAGVGWQKPLGLYSLFTATFDYTNQELVFSQGEYVKVYSFSVGYRYKF
ncbi:MAG: YaiO family outer membrane beta-barrel protein [Bacteroidota bacterium]|nr:YaiO family outer membrane beta-barrel protein [Bacteroidota bacterium]